MREAGLVMSINSDDPTMMHIDLTHEYQLAMDELGFTPADIKASIMASVEHCWLDEATRRQWLRDWPAEIDAILAPMIDS
jgi:adenosine deaminase